MKQSFILIQLCAKNKSLKPPSLFLCCLFSQCLVFLVYSTVCIILKAAIKKKEQEEIVILEIPWQGFLAHGDLRNRDSGHVICSTSLVAMAAGKPGVSRETESVNNPNVSC